MTTQTTGVPATPPALPTATLTDAQIRRENADAASASLGYEPPALPGASDAVTPPPLPNQAEVKNQGDLIRRGQDQNAADREDFMADIARRRREHMVTDMPDDGYGVDIVEETEDNQPQEQVTQAAQVVQQPQEVATQVTDDQPRFFTDATGKRMVELLVNGNKMVVDETRVLAAAQKLEAGDERLREANFQRQQIEAERQQLERERAALQIPQPSAMDAENLKQQLRAGFDKVYNEGDETALDGLVDLLVQGRANPAPLSLDQVTDAAISRLNQNAWNGALQRDVAAYESDPAYADITGNPMLAQRAVALATDYMTRHPEVRSNGTTPRQVMDHCAGLVRTEAQAYAKALGVQVAPQPQEQQGQSRAAATEQRKTQAGNTVVSGGAQRQDTAQRTVAQDGGRSPSSIDSKVAAFSGLQDMRNNSVVRR